MSFIDWIPSQQPTGDIESEDPIACKTDRELNADLYQELSRLKARVDLIDSTLREYARKREQAKIKKLALAKLSEAEKEALGIKSK